MSESNGAFKQVVVLKEPVFTTAGSLLRSNGNIAEKPKYLSYDSAAELSRDDIKHIIDESKRMGLCINLSGRNLRFMDLRNLDLSGSYLVGANLIGSILENTNFTAANLS